MLTFLLPQQGPGVPDDDFELLPVRKLAKEDLAKEKAAKVKGGSRQRIPGVRRIKEIEDPAVAKKLSRFSTKIENEDKPNHLSSSATARESIEEKEDTVVATKHSRFSSSRKSSIRPHIRMKIKEKDESPDSEENTEDEKNSPPSLREKSSSTSFRRISSPSGRMKKPAAHPSVSSREETAEPHIRPVSRSRGGGHVSRSRGRGRVREQQDQSAEASQVASDEKTSAEDEDSEAKENENGVGGVTAVPKARVRQPPSLASVVRHRFIFSVEISMESHLLF